MHGNLFKIVLISIITVVLGIVAGVMSSETTPTSLILTIAPFMIALLCVMKENVWYLWFLLPPLLTPFPHGWDYGHLLVYSAVLPFYLWNAIIGRTQLTWNTAPLLDLIVTIFFLHVFILFIRYPFGFGLNILQEYYGGKGYVVFAQAVLVYLCLSSLKATSDQVGRMLQWVIGIVVLIAVFSTVRGWLRPDAMANDPAMMAATGGGSGASFGDSRQAGFLRISSVVAGLLVLNFSVVQMIKKPWWGMLLLLSCVGIMLSGFRSALANIVILFGVVSVLYKRWFVGVVAPVIGLAVLTLMSATGILHSFPHGIQRTLAALPWMDVDRHARASAEGSSEWRYEMWRWALDPREKLIRDYVWGDGFVRHISIIKSISYENAYGLRHDQSDFARNGSWHSGPVSTISTMGYVGLSLYLVMSIIGICYAWIVSKAFLYHKYKLGILYVTTYYIMGPFSFLLIFGVSEKIAFDIMTLGTIKLLYNCAKREGLYIPPLGRRHYTPMMVAQTMERQEQERRHHMERQAAFARQKSLAAPDEMSS